MSLRVTAAVALLALAATGACGVPTGNDTFSEIPPDEIQFGLDATSTTTTTTSTTSTTVPVLPETTALATTTTIRLEPVQIYFLSRGRLQPITIDLPPGSSPEQVADVLEAGPPPDIALDTLIRDGLIVSSVEEGGVLTVDLDPDTFDRVPSTQQTEAIGQIVLTMLSSLRGVGQVTFTLGGEAIAVKKGNGQLSDVGEPLSYDDYANLLVAPRSPADVTSTPTSLDQ
jgi:Sporulation and spore germination